jgi:2-amino-4-hydroxy-6-hydroxymethyldihydropteridine diphosphokinase
MANGTAGRASRSVLIGLLGLGSNVGDRRAQLQAALDALPGAGIEVLACSSVYDTDPVGEVLDQPSFLNACVRIRTAHEPLALLDAVKGLERELGRAPAGVRHGPRARGRAPRAAPADRRHGWHGRAPDGRRHGRDASIPVF